MPIVANIFSGLKYVSFPMTPSGAKALEDVINTVTENNGADSIVGITLLPSEFVPSKKSGISVVKSSTKNLTLCGYFYDPVNDPHQLHGYIPKNAKMFTSPYMFISIDTLETKSQYMIEKIEPNNKESLQNAWENEKDLGITQFIGRVRFTASGGASPTPDIIIHPTDKYDNADGKMNSTIMTGFPQLPFVIDSYRAYVASQGGEFALGMKNMLGVAGSALQMFGGGTSAFAAAHQYYAADAYRDIRGIGFLADQNAIVRQINAVQRASNGFGNIVSGMQNITGQLADLYVKTHKGDTARGNTNYSSGMIGTRAKNIFVSQVGVNLSDAKKIDNFFSMYGYAVNQIEVPTYNARPSWNFIKTKQCNVTGEMPNEAIDKIKSIFNNGITWWKNIQTMLDYSQDNSPITN
ncbi:MAG: hypothetical protein J6V44_09530 [Methanobrevibacter sp.]|nr:hypothetical protein [Methanobrevibacter sp.]